MTAAQIFGMAALGAALGALLVSSLIALVRILAVRRALQRMTRGPAFRAISGLPTPLERVKGAFERLETLTTRLDAVVDELAAAARSGARFAMEVGLVASATEDLLDTFVPSMRGSV